MNELMNLSDKNFLKKVEEYTNNLIQHKADINLLIDEVIKSGKDDEFEQLTFTAKYISGMMRVLKSAPGIPEVTTVDHVKKDLNENMKKGIDQLKEIISSADEKVKLHFEETYFTLTTQSFTNITGLFSDLESVKKYLNFLKRQT